MFTGLYLTKHIIDFLSKFALYLHTYLIGLFSGVRAYSELVQLP